MKTALYLVPIAVIGALLFTFVSYKQPAPVEVAELPQAGAVPGDTLNGKFWTVGGVTEFRDTCSFKSATTTVCAIRTPNATTTANPGSIAANFVTSSTTASRVTIARASTCYATTTALALMDVAAGAKATVVATTTSTALTDGLIAPNSCIVVGMSGGIGHFSPTGELNIRLMVAQ